VKLNHCGALAVENGVGNHWGFILVAGITGNRVKNGLNPLFEIFLDRQIVRWWDDLKDGAGHVATHLINL
jgi:hypothetical protein